MDGSTKELEKHDDDFEKLYKLYQYSPAREFLMFHPTGSGKTKKAAEYTKYLLKSNLIDNAIIIVSNAKLVDTFKDEFDDHMPPEKYSVVTIAEFCKATYPKQTFTSVLYILDEVHNFLPKTELQRLKNTKRPMKKTVASSSQAVKHKVNKYKAKYYKILQQTFVTNFSRFVLGLSATPFSNDVFSEAKGYMKLLCGDVTGAKRQNQMIEYFAQRTSFPSKEVFDRYPCKITFGTRENGYTETQIMDYTQPLLDFPAYEVRENETKVQAVVNNMLRIKKNMKKINKPAKHFVVSYLIQTQAELENALAKEGDFKVIKVTSGNCTSSVLDSIKLFNYTDTDNCVLLATTFLSEGIGLKNVTHVHIVEPFHDYTAQDTIQVLGRSCRIGSHSKSDGPQQRYLVHTYLYKKSNETDNAKFQSAIRKEKEIRNFLSKVRQKQITILSKPLIEKTFIISPYNTNPDCTAQESHAFYNLTSKTIITCIHNETEKMIHCIDNWETKSGFKIYSELMKLSAYNGFGGEGDGILRERIRSLQLHMMSRTRKVPSKCPVDALIHHAKDLHLMLHPKASNRRVEWRKEKDSHKKDDVYFREFANCGFEEFANCGSEDVETDEEKEYESSSDEWYDDDCFSDDSDDVDSNETKQQNVFSKEKTVKQKHQKQTFESQESTTPITDGFNNLYVVCPKKKISCPKKKSSKGKDEFLYLQMSFPVQY